jgi:hypothetical protein
MKIREENCNMVLLGGVALVSVAISGAAALVPPSQAVAVEKKPFHLADQTPVRVVGAPLVLNTNPRER